MKDEFLATLSHELRTPLSAILGWTHLLARPNIVPADVARAAMTIERNARAQARLIEDLLDVSRIMSGKLRLDIQPVPIAAVFETVVASLKPAPTRARSRCSQSDGASAGDVLADASRLQQIVWNLLSNAIKFTPPGGHVTLGADRREHEVVVRVSDDGVGIAPSSCRTSSSASARPSRARRGARRARPRPGDRPPAGRAARRHGRGEERRPRSRRDLLGASAARSRPRSGSPPHRRGARPGDDAPDGRSGPLGPRILLVDDEADGREMLTRILERWGADVAPPARRRRRSRRSGRARPTC